MEQLYRSKQFKNVRFSRSITYGTKTAQSTALDRLKNRVMLCVFVVFASLHRLAWRLKNNYARSRAPSGQ